MKLNKNKADVRELNDMKMVVYDKEWLKTASEDLKLYYMFRDLAETDYEKNKIRENDLRYDITIMEPAMLGMEFNKTMGHDHPIVPGTAITYPEIYEVLKGEAIFLMQDSKNDEIKDVIAIKAQKNDKVIILPNYEHLIINISDSETKTCNWICRRFESNIYKPFRARHGFCYYAIKTGAEIEWVKNHNYESINPIRWIEPNNFYNFDLPKRKPLYELVKELRKLDFLKKPQKYEWS